MRNLSGDRILYLGQLDTAEQLKQLLALLYIKARDATPGTDKTRKACLISWPIVRETNTSCDCQLVGHGNLRGGVRAAAQAAEAAGSVDARAAACSYGSCSRRPRVCGGAGTADHGQIRAGYSACV